jgi:hypothetical protein
MENDFLQGWNNYPKTVSGAYHLLTNWKKYPWHALREVGAVGDSVSFHNMDDKDGQQQQEWSAEKAARRTSCATDAKRRGTMPRNVRSLHLSLVIRLLVILPQLKHHPSPPPHY